MASLESMPRTREFDPAAALQKVVSLFAQKGYDDTSMDDIVRATGVSRYGLYSTFGSKRELFEQALEKFADDMGRQSFLRLLEPDASLDDVRRIFDERVDWLCCDGASGCCLLNHTATTMASEDAEIRGLLLRFLKRMSRTFTVGLENANEKGELREDLDLRDAGEYLTGAMFGVVTLARAGFPRSALDNFVDNTISGLARQPGEQTARTGT